MRTPFLKTTTSLCLTLSLVQPLPGVVWAQSPAPDCVPGTKDCPLPLPKKPDAKAPATTPTKRPTAPQIQRPQPRVAPPTSPVPQSRTPQTIQRQVQPPTTPRTRIQTQPPALQQQPRVVAPPMPVPQTRTQQQNQRQIQPTPTAPQPATPRTRTQTQPPALQQQPRVVTPPTPVPQTRTQQQNQRQIQPTPTAPQPATPRTRTQTQPPALQQQPRVVTPPTPAPQTRTQQQNQRQIQPTPIAPQPQTRLPQAAQVPPAGVAEGAATSSIRIAPADLRPSSENRFRPRPSSGLTDLEKFGLIVLGAAIVGALLSDGQRVILNSGDRVVARDPFGRYHVYHDDNVLLRRPGSTITTRRYHDGSLLTRILYPSGIIIFTISSYDGRMLRRWVQYPHRPTVVLFDDTRVLPPPVIAQLPPRSPVSIVYTDRTSPDLLRHALLAQPLQPLGRYFNLDQIRNIAEVRYLVPEVEIASVRFASGSAAIGPDQARSLTTLAHVMTDMIAQNPAELFLIEGHSDAVGNRAMNLALSDARAEAMAAALTEYYGVPPQNMVTQGYGESDPKEQTLGPSEENRRTILRRITDLLPPAAE